MGAKLKNIMVNLKIMKLLVTLVVLLMSFQISNAQSKPDTVQSITKSSTVFRLTDPLYLSMFNYPLIITQKVRLPLSARMGLSPVYSPDYLTKYQVVSNDPVGILAEMLTNSLFYLFERRKLQNYDQRYWRLFWPP